MKSRHSPDPIAAGQWIRRRTGFAPRIALVLGSGFGPVADALPDAQRIPYSTIPGFIAGSVPGHAGELVLGTWHGVPVAILAGRVHYYEGADPEACTLGIRVLAELGVTEVLLTNAAGGIRRSLRPGQFLALSDHINLTGVNPLRGPAIPGRNRFIDMSAAYDPLLRQRLKKAARSTGIRLTEGVYLAVSGPSFETPAEIRAFARLGADAVGMSTVFETIVARQCGLRVAGLSCITNVAAGLGRPDQEVSHQEVLDVARTVASKATALVGAWVRRSAPVTPTRGKPGKPS
jgi:purine-nucleoside phosphorylase